MGEQVEDISLRLPAALAQNDSFNLPSLFFKFFSRYYYFSHLLNSTCNYFAVPTLMPFGFLSWWKYPCYSGLASQY